MDSAAPDEAATLPDPSDERPCLDWAAGPELTIAQASEVHAEWLQLLEARPARLTLSLDAVEEFDSAGVQLLLSLRRSAHRWDCDCRIASCSPAVHRALADYRLESALGLLPETGDGQGGSQESIEE